MCLVLSVGDELVAEYIANAHALRRGLGAWAKKPEGARRKDEG